MTQVTGILTDEVGTVLANTTCAVVAIDQVVGQDGGGRVSRGSIVVTDGAGEFDADIKPGRYELVVEVSAPADANVKFNRIGRLTVLTTGPMTLEDALDASFGPINPSILQQAIDARDDAEAAAVLAQSAYQGRQYATRAEFVADDTYAPDDGTVVYAASMIYVAFSSATAIPDKPGFLPGIVVYPDHFAENLTPGTTNMRAALAAALAYSDVTLRPTDYFVTHNETVFLTLVAGRTLHLNGGRILCVSSGLTYYRLFDELGATIEGPGTLEIQEATASGVLIGTAGTKHRYRNVDFVGNVDYTGSKNWDGYAIQFLDGTGDNTNWRVDGCSFSSMQFPILKSNAATGTQRDLRFTNCDFFENFREDLSFNSPAGIMTDIIVSGCTFRDSKSVDVGNDALYLAFASVQGFQVLGNKFSGKIRECVHIEEDCSDFIISGNLFECEHPSGVTSSAIALLHADANNTGTRGIPKRGAIFGNVGRNVGAAKQALTLGIFVINNITEMHSGEEVAIYDNEMANYATGYAVNASMDKAVDVKNNRAIRCGVGFATRAAGALLGTISGFDKNKSILCDTGVMGNRGAVFDNHVFDRCVATLSVTSFFVTLNDPTFLFEVVDTINGSINVSFFALTANSRVVGDFTIMVLTKDTPHYSNRVAAVNWDGNTYAAPVYDMTVQPGGLQTFIESNSGNLRLRVFSNAIRENCNRRVTLNGTMVLHS